MKKYKIAILSTLIFIFTFFSSGCWNYREINVLSMVAGIAVDKSSDGSKFLLSIEVVQPGGGKDKKTVGKIIQSDGDTIFDAIRNATKFTGKKLYFSHTKIAIVSQNIAKSGIRPLVDWCSRDAEPRRELYIMVSKEKSAQEILKPNGEPKEVRSFDIFAMMEAQKVIAKSPNIQLYRLNNILAADGISGTIPVINMVGEDKKNVEVSGTAILNQDKLIGFLDENDTKYLYFVRNRLKTTLLTEKIKNIGDNTNTPNLSLEVFNSKTKIKPDYSDGKVMINMDIDADAAISEMYSYEGDIVDEKNRELIKAQAEKELENNIQEVVKKVQKTYGVDIFGFGSKLKADNPTVWKKVSKDWNQEFRNLELKVKADIKIRNAGIQGNPINIGG